LILIPEWHDELATFINGIISFWLIPVLLAKILGIISKHNANLLKEYWFKSSKVLAFSYNFDDRMYSVQPAPGKNLLSLILFLKIFTASSIALSISSKKF